MTRTVLLGDVVTIKGGKRLPKGKILQESSNSHPYLRIVDMGERHVKKTDLQYVPDEVFPKISRYITNTNDVLLSIVGTIGLVAIVDKQLDNASLTENCVKLTCDTTKIDPNFLYYFLTSSSGQSEIRAGRVGSTQPKLPLYNIEKIRIPHIALETQKKIANILSAIDEKIELNRKMNETLEQIGQTLFRHYFIDNPEVETWEKRKLGEFFPVKTGKKDANYSQEDGKYPFYTCSQTVSRAPGYSFDGAAILLAGNGDFNIKYYTGRFEAYQRTYVLMPSNEKLLGFLYFLMKRDLHLITGGSRGSVIKFITKGMIEDYKTSLPSDAKLSHLAEPFKKIIESIAQNNQEIQTLTTLRDTLIPRLISGRVKV